MQLAEVTKTCSTFEKDNSEMKTTVADLTLKLSVLKDKVTSYRHDWEKKGIGSQLTITLTKYIYVFD